LIYLYKTTHPKAAGTQKQVLFKERSDNKDRVFFS